MPCIRSTPNTEGVNRFIQEGTSHTPFTTLIEKLDNSQKAINICTDNNDINEPYGEIKCYYTNEGDKYNLDNGCGIRENEIENCLNCFHISDSNNNSLSKCGMGLNAAILTEIKNPNDYGYSFIISKTSNNEDYSIIFIFYYQDNLYHIMINGNRWNVDLEDNYLKYLINEHGTIIHTTNERNFNIEDIITINNDNIDISNKEIIKN